MAVVVDSDELSLAGSIPIVRSKLRGRDRWFELLSGTGGGGSIYRQSMVSPRCDNGAVVVDKVHYDSGPRMPCGEAWGGLRGQANLG